MFSKDGLEKEGKGIDIGHRRAHSAEHIHVGAPVPQAFPASDIVIHARIKLHGCRQDEKKPTDPRGVAPDPQQTEIPSHTQHKKRHGEDNADNKLSRLLPDLGPPGGQLRVLFLFGFRRPDRPVARLFDGCDHIVYARDSGQVFHGRAFGGKINRSVQDTGNLFLQGPLDVCGAIGAGHASYGYGDF